MNIKLYENERIDDLQFKDLKIIQNPNGFCFGIDAVLLANYAKIKKNAKVIDLGTGTGIIPILISGKSDASKIYGIEIQDEVADMACRSVKLNNLDSRIEIINEDLKNISNILDKNSFDVVTSNPPYMHAEGLVNTNSKKAISRHEIKCNIEDIIRVSRDLLKENGKLFMINRTLRLVDIMSYARMYKLEPKKIRFVHSKIGKAPKLVLIEFVKGAKPEIKMQDPLYIYNEDGTYTDEILKIYSTTSIRH